MGSAFHQLCPRYSGTLTPTAPTAIRLWETFTFLYQISMIVEQGPAVLAVGAGWGCLDIFFLSAITSLFFLPLSWGRPDID